MIRILKAALLSGVACVWAGGAWAEDVALVIANGSYRSASGIGGTDDFAALSDRLEQAGFRVFSARDADAARMQAQASAFVRAADGTGRVVIALAGHFASFGGQSWLLGTDTGTPDPVTAGATGLSLPVLLAVAGRAPGQAVVLLGTEQRRIALEGGMVPGVDRIEVPQGVTVLSGAPRRLADLADGLLRPGVAVGVALDGYPDVAPSGFVSDAVPFLDAADASGTPVRPPPDAEAERTAFALAERANTIAAWRGYLDAWPRGANADRARAALARLMADPAVAASEVETALGLTRQARREIQQALSLLEYDTRGIDGLFGPGTRAAIRAWQSASGYAATGYLTRDQIVRLDAQAARRSAELEAEAAARQAEQERRDRAWWQETGAAGDEPGLRAYLDRFPDGLFADVARARLAPIEADRAEAAAASDRLAWDRATGRDDVAAYRGYLAEQPGGAFREQAEDRIAVLESAQSNAGAEAEEAGLNLNRFTRNLVEARLAALGLDPGEVDGRFDDRTRRAIRRYQEARDLPVTGYLSQPTVVRLLADSLVAP